MSLMIATLTGCGKKDDDVPVIQNETATQLEIPGIPAPEPEPEPTCEDYFPHVALLGSSLSDVEAEYEVLPDEFEEEILRYSLGFIELAGLYYDVYAFTDDDDNVTKVQYDFDFGDKYGDIVDAQLQDTTVNLETIYGYLQEVGAVDVVDEGSIIDVVEDFNSGKLYNGTSYYSSLEVEGVEISFGAMFNSLTKGMVVLQSVSFESSNGDSV